MRPEADGALRELLDRQAIAEVLTDYCRHLDAMDLAALAALFTEEAHVVWGDDARLAARGGAAVAAALARMWRWRRTAHHLANIRIWFDGADAARAESAVLAWHERPDGSTATVFGLYLDRLRRDAGGWRIAARRMEARGSDAGFRLPVPPAHRAPPPPGWTPPDGLDGPAGPS